MLKEQKEEYSITSNIWFVVELLSVMAAVAFLVTVGGHMLSIYIIHMLTTQGKELFGPWTLPIAVISLAWIIKFWEKNDD